MAVLIMAELKFITTANGAQCVMMTGISMTLMWFAVSLVSPVRPRHLIVHGMAKDLALSGWMTSGAVGERIHCFNAHIVAGEEKTVAIVRMQAWSVTVSLRMQPCLIWIQINSNVYHAYLLTLILKSLKSPYG